MKKSPGRRGCLSCFRKKKDDEEEGNGGEGKKDSEEIQLQSLNEKDEQERAEGGSGTVAGRSQHRAATDERRGPERRPLESQFSFSGEGIHDTDLRRGGGGLSLARALTLLSRSEGSMSPTVGPPGSIGKDGEDEKYRHRLTSEAKSLLHGTNIGCHIKLPSRMIYLVVCTASQGDTGDTLVLSTKNTK